MNKRKRLWHFALGILLTLTLLIPSSGMSLYAAEPSTGSSTETVPVSPSPDTITEEPTTPSTEEPAEEPSEDPKPVLHGLVRDENGNLYYYKNGKKIKNQWKKVNKNKYYFGKSGKAYTGKRKIGKSTYYFSEKGKMKTGWKTISKKTYYFQPKSGKMVTGKKTISHFLCYFSEKGVLTRKIDKNKKMVALTYDDGPSIYTPRILKTLKDNNSVATFFVVGSRVSTYSKTIRQAYDNGCEIGNHTYNHKILTRVGKTEVQNQVSKTNEAVKKITGVNPVVMRPPGGGTNSDIKSWVGMPSILWSIDTLDWRTRNSASTQQAVLNHIKDGDIVLMHDLYEATANASQTIIPTLVSRGYQLVTVSELAECRGGMKQTGSYFQFRN